MKIVTMQKLWKRNKEKILLFILAALLMTTICIGCNIKVNAVDKAAIENEKALKAFEEFLDGTRKVYIEAETQKELKNVIGSELNINGSGALLQDLLNEINNIYYGIYEKEPKYRMESVEYAYLDCFHDGKQELAIKFKDLVTNDYLSLTAIIVFENDKLFLRHAFEDWSRCLVDLNYYGYVTESGSGGAFAHSYEEYFIDENGRKLSVYDAEFYWDSIDDAELSRQMFNIDDFYVTKQEYTINKKTCLNFATDNESISEETWEEFCDLYSLKHETIYTDDEINELIRRRENEMGIDDDWKTAIQPEWKSLENALYSEYIKEIELFESRKTRQKESSSVLKNKWVAIGAEPYDYDTDINYDRLGINYTWLRVLEDVLADYGSIVDIPNEKWSLERIIYYGDHIFAATVHCDEPEREICFLINSEAINMDMPEYIEYIVAVDYQYHVEDGISCSTGSYDSMLNWTSYKEQSKINSNRSYIIRGSEAGLYDNINGFDYPGIYAMSQYLTDKNAATYKIWSLDTNAVCPIAGGNMVIISYTYGNEQVVMVLDDKNKKFAIVKGLDE